MESNQKTNKKEIIIIACVLLVLVLGVGLYFLLAPKGATAVITVNNPIVSLKNHDGKVLATTSESNPTLRIPLSDNGIYTLYGTNLQTVTLEINDGGIHFIQSICPDHLCEGFGWLRLNSQFATCLPAGVNVTVEE